MQRRTFVTGAGTGLLSLAGCLGVSDSAVPGDGPTNGTDASDPGGGTDHSPVPPAACPTSQDLGVEWPETLDAATVESFVEAYEAAYYRDVVVEFESESGLGSYELSGRVTGGPTVAGDGWELEYSGGGGVYTPTLLLEATRAAPPDGADVVPANEIDDAALTGTLAEAAETGSAQYHVDSPGEEVDRYLDLFASRSEDFEPLADRHDSDSLYVDVDGTTVELTAEPTGFHGDYAWTAWYYVDERVVRRTSEEATDPREGTVLECRTVD